jgi:DHA1 family tetracycline resistance protein-like MFS transporter
MQKRLPVIFILITVMIDAMDLGLMMPVMPDLIQEIRGADLGQAALWGGILATSFAVMQFCSPPPWAAFPTATGGARCCW